MNDQRLDTYTAMQRQYGTANLLDALAAEFANDPPERRFSATELAMLDQLHTRGLAATIDFAARYPFTATTRVLDAGAGLGGPARYLAETYHCRVAGVDASEELVRASQALTERWSGDAALVEFRHGDILALPYDDEVFDVVWMQHVAMNVRERNALYSEVRRVLRSGGRFMTYDVATRGSELHYPTPWARSANESTVLTQTQTHEALEGAGLTVESSVVDTPAALAWLAQSVAAQHQSPPPRGMRFLRAALGDDVANVLGNLGKNYRDGLADVLAIVAVRA